MEKVMPKNYIAKLQCKKINDTTAAYSNPQDLPYTDKENLTNTYIQNYDSLRIFPHITSFKQLKNDTETQQQLIDQIRNENKEEIDILKTRVNRFIASYERVRSDNDLLEMWVQTYGDEKFIKKFYELKAKK
ncbi:MAG: hypothetical protein NWE89_06070 [Candidatus Bathyarchaeota archaeon]|nr:hypothetical protein [Candidatus Bathyarchaeota archaeon]